jgi:hypothetical protein
MKKLEKPCLEVHKLNLGENWSIYTVLDTMCVKEGNRESSHEH